MRLAGGLTLLLLLTTPAQPTDHSDCPLSLQDESLTASCPVSEKMSVGKKVALVLGASGETGKEVVRSLVNSELYSQVNVITRRQLDFPQDDPNYQKVQQKIVDFDQLEESSSAFSGAATAFCCLGTTRAVAGAEGFVKVDHDYVLNSARILRSNNCSDFHLLTSKGASASSWLLYPSTKGKVENAVMELGFPRLSVYRPGLLLCDRPNRPRRMFEEFAQKVAGWIDKSHGWSIPTNLLAAAMVSNAGTEQAEAVKILEHHEIVNILNR